MIKNGQQIGAYQVEEAVGRGGMASVYRAYHPATDRHVALKVMLPEIAVDETFRQRFEREAKVLAGLQHIHILPVFDYGEQDGITYLVMPLLPGQTLNERIQGQPLTLQETARLFRQLASALDYAHGQGVLHRDIKPSNIMIDASHNALLADFGLTRLIREAHADKLTSDSTVIGTPLYMSPEQGQGHVLGAQSDLYSLSVVLYEMLTGAVPFTADTPVAVIFKHVSDPIPSPLGHRPDLPPGIENVLEKALAKKPADRFTTALEIADAFEAAIEGEPPGMRLAGLASNDGELNTAQVEALGEQQAAYQPAPAAKPKHQPTASSALRLPLALIGSMLAGVLILGLFGVAAVLMIAPVSSFKQATLDHVLSFAAHEGRVSSMAVQDDLLITGGGDSLAQVWDIADDLNEATGLIHTIEGHAGSVTTVAIRPDAGEYMTGGAGGTAFRWDAETGDMKVTNLVGSSVSGGVYSPDGELSAEIYVKTLSVGPLSEPFEEAFSLVDLPAQPTNPNDSAFRSVAFSPVHETTEADVTVYRLVTADSDGFVQQWEARYDLDISDDAAESFLVEGGAFEDAPRRLSLQLLDNIEIDASRITQVIYSPDAAYIAASTISGLVRIVDSATMAQYRIFPEEYGEVRDIAFSPDGNYLAAATENVDVLVWEIQSGQLAHEIALPDEDDSAQQVVFTAGGMMLVGTEAGMIYGWDASGLAPAAS